MSTSPTPFEPGNGLPSDPDARVGDIKQLRDLSRKYMEDNYWKEFEEVWRAVLCRTKPIMVIDKSGQKVEDKNRTNVCMPELAIAVKRKTARLTANPPNLRYNVPGDDNSLLGERLTGRAYYEYDRSGESVEFRRGVQQAETFGFNYFKTYHDEVTVQRQMRYLRAKLRDRRQLMKVQGAGDDEIDNAIQQRGTEVSDAEIGAAIEENGPEIRAMMPFTVYEGPVTKCRFIGDIALEPGCLTLNASGWVFENYTETDLWLQRMVKKTYKDPETGIDVPVFTGKAAQELLDKDSKLPQDRLHDLKRILRAAVQQVEPRLEKRLLPNKRFEIDEYHSTDKYGRIWVEYLGNDSVYLGRHPYAVDFWGRWAYTEFIPWPNLIGAIGDSSPRLLRFLHRMHNAAVGSRQDLISNILRRNYIAESEEDIPEQIIRREFGNIIVLKGGAGGFRALEEPDVPGGAWQTEAQIKSEMTAAEPAIGGIEAPGGEFNPMAGKTATTSILANKSNDALIQLELDSLNICVKELGEKKLEIHRQLADSQIPVPGKYMPEAKRQQAYQYRDSLLQDSSYREQFDVLSQRFDKTSLVTIDPYEIQDMGIEVEPEAGSTLAVDDQLKTNGIMQFYQVAQADPVHFNVQYACEQVAGTIRGIDKTKAINPPQPPTPPAPKANLNISLPLDKADSVPADILNQVLQEFGFQPSQDVIAKQEMDAIQHASNTANAASNLLSPAQPGQPATGVPAAVLKGQTTKIDNAAQTQ